jgi:hypothetical protein
MAQKLTASACFPFSSVGLHCFGGMQAAKRPGFTAAALGGSGNFFAGTAAHFGRGVGAVSWPQATAAAASRSTAVHGRALRSIILLLSVSAEDKPQPGRVVKQRLPC